MSDFWRCIVCSGFFSLVSCLCVDKSVAFAFFATALVALVAAFGHLQKVN